MKRNASLKFIQRASLLIAIVSCFADAIFTAFSFQLPLPSLMSFQSGLLLIILGMQFELYYRKQKSDMTLTK